MIRFSTPEAPCALALCASTLLLAGCLDDLSTQEDGDAGATAEGGAGASTEVDGIVNTTTVDASDEAQWVHFDFDSGEEIEDGDDAWDIALLRFKIKSNGGISGDGGVAVAILTDMDFDELEEAPDEGYLEDMEDGGDEDGDEDFVFLAEGAWYEYDGSDHTLTARDWVYVVRSTEARFFKVQVLDYYDDAGTSGFPKFRWAEIEAPSADVEVEVLDGGAPEEDARDPSHYGCYAGPPDHSCDCEVSEEACEGTWTEQCACSESEGNADAYGCYAGAPSHECDCGTDEPSCAAGGGTWTDSCAC